ncbi:hypothetical protein V6N12_058585 [Hibiscus sabdariffa]|uniref:Uncharacterized protein n=1 Tax=Hibiscus sabdariffa TaxID=183260 RepID=A0ABR2EUH2_9ROSI
MWNVSMYAVKATHVDEGMNDGSSGLVRKKGMELVQSIDTNRYMHLHSLRENTMTDALNCQRQNLYWSKHLYSCRISDVIAQMGTCISHFLKAAISKVIVQVEASLVFL